METRARTSLLALMAATRSPRKLARALVAHPDPAHLASLTPPGRAHWHTATRQSYTLDALRIAVVPVWEAPAWLRRLADLPPALFVRGDVTLLAERAVAIVGARRASARAMQWAAARASEAVAAGDVVASGGALGIDAAAHGAALRAGGRTVAYLGVAADRVYPAANRDLLARILMAHGALVSEHPPGAPTRGHEHARRNRFIAAHAGAVFIAEAGLRSGALGTASEARRLGVPVWVSPPGCGSERGGIDVLVGSGEAGVSLKTR